MAKKKTNIPLGKMLDAIDRCDFDFYANLTPEEKKAFSPWLAMRYASSAKNKHSKYDTYHYLLMVNDIVNKDFNVFSPRKSDGHPGHPELQWKLLAACGAGRKTYHPWIPPPKRPEEKIRNFIHKTYPLMKRDEVTLFLELNSREDLKELARDTGMDDKDIKDLFK